VSQDGFCLFGLETRSHLLNDFFSLAPSRRVNLAISSPIYNCEIQYLFVYEHSIYLFPCGFFNDPFNIKQGMMQKEAVMD
jgi:hypothetical protein